MPEVNIPDFENTKLNSLLDPGVYTFTIKDPPTLEPAQSSGKLKLVYKAEVLDGPPQKDDGANPAGRVQFVTIPDFMDTGRSRVKQLLISAGFLRRDDKESPMARGNFNTDDLVGAIFKAVLEPSDYNGKPGRKIEKYITS
jgi:hypothetical protein